MNNPDKHSDLFIGWINNELTPEELRQIESDPDYQKYSAILGEIDQWKVPALDKKGSYERLIARRTKTRTINWYQSNVFKMAAVFLLLAVALTWFIFLDRSVVTYETGIAETEEITLPDGSVVHLGASSQLSYNKKTWEINRDLKLEGTSHFDVVHGSPFKVDFAHGTVEVLGTSFEIKSLENFASVLCYDGKVRVNTTDTTAVITRGRGVRIDRGRASRVFKFQNHAWSHTLTRFYSTPLSAVFESMELQFGVEFNTGNIDLTRTFTGSYSNQDIDLAMKIVCNAMNLSYEKNENTVTLQ